MNPLVGEVDLHTVDVGYLLVLVELLHLLQDSIDVGGRVKVDAILGNEILRQRVAQFRGLHTSLCQISEQEGDTYERVASAVGCGVDHAAIALAADNGTRFAHLHHNVHLTHGSRSIVAAVFLGHVA